MNFDLPSSSFAFYSALLGLKVVSLAFYVSFNRVKTSTYACVGATNDKVELARRAHANDIENLVPFVVCGAAYLASGPSIGMALLHFRVFTVARFMHTFGILYMDHRMFRGLPFMIGSFIIVSMGIQALMGL